MTDTTDREKDEARERAAQGERDDGKNFERFEDFARRLMAVPKSNITQNPKSSRRRQ